VLTSDETCDDGNTLGSPDGTVDGCSQTATPSIPGGSVACQASRAPRFAVMASWKAARTAMTEYR